LTFSDGDAQAQLRHVAFTTYLLVAKFGKIRCRDGTWTAGLVTSMPQPKLINAVKGEMRTIIKNNRCSVTTEMDKTLAGTQPIYLYDTLVIYDISA
jgi:hypothetical protein